MKLVIEKVLERDIDLLMINKIMYDENVLNLFLSKINKYDYKVFSVQHSLMDQVNGESDITVILENNNHKIALLIEDKIDALAMPMQPERYVTRGKIGVKSKQYNEFYVFIIAPLDYLETNQEAKKYKYRISYEELKETMSNDLYATTLLNKAIEEKKSGYIINENPSVTSFWNRYYDYIKEHYPTIRINKIHGPRGHAARWPILTTDYKSVVIYQKSNQGYLDLTFYKMGLFSNIFYKYVEKFLDKDMIITKIKNSMVVRINIPIINFDNSFYKQIDNIKFSLDNSLRFYELLKKINVYDMYKEIEPINADIKTIEDFNRLYPKGIIVNYDIRGTYRESTGTVEKFADIVDYPYVQRYQKGKKTKTDLFMIRNNTLQRLKRIEPNNPNSNYYIEDIKETVLNDFYNDKKLITITNKPVNVKSEELYEIIDME